MDFNSTIYRTARKAHRCEECGRTIEPGERYSRTAAVWEGDFFTNVACLHCARARMVADYADNYYNEVYYGGLSEWVDNDDQDETLRIRAGFRARWRYQSGALMPLPESPWSGARRLVERLERAS
jgi:ribosomal protein S27E